MRAGQLRNQLVIEENVAAKDGYGHQDGEDWQPFATVWGSVEAPTPGSEGLTEGQAVSAVAMVIRTRFLQGVTAGMRVRHQLYGTELPRYYDVGAVQDPDGRRRELLLSVNERA